MCLIFSNTSNSKGYGSQWSPYCNTFDLLLGIIVYNTDDVMTVFSMVAQQATSISLNSAAYNATYATIASSSPEANPIISTPHWLNRSFDFCTIVDGNGTSCSMIALNLYDIHDFTITQYSYQLLDGCCNNTVSISPTAWEQLKSVPPTTLTQNYYKCTEQWYVALFNAVGK